MYLFTDGPGQDYKIEHRQAFCPQVQHPGRDSLPGNECISCERSERVPESFSPLVESSFHDPCKKGFIAFQVFNVVPAQADDCRLNAGWRVKYRFIYRKEVIDLKKGLQQYTEDAIGFVSGRRADTFSNLFLKHTNDLFYPVACFEDFEKDLGGDVVGEITDEGEESRMTDDG